MINVSQPPEPPDFDQKVRQPGQAWLNKNLDSQGKPPSNKKIPAKWRTFKNNLADGFANLCAYSAMYEPVGTIDHYLSCENHPTQAYEWANYRYASGWINASKGTLDHKILDPFEVEDSWFEILLPSLQLVLTKHIPLKQRQRAKFTLERLHLGNDERVIRQRQIWHTLYREGKITLAALRYVAPLIARAIEKRAM